MQQKLEMHLSIDGSLKILDYSKAVNRYRGLVLNSSLALV